METLSQTLERYLAARVDLTTGAQYRTFVTSLIEFLQQYHVEVDTWAKLRRKPHIERWLLMLATAKPPYKNDTRRHFIYRVRKFLRDISRWEWPESPPTEVFSARDLPRSNRVLPKKKAKKRKLVRQKRAPETDLHEVMERYLALRATTLRPSTVEHYRQGIRSLIRFMRVPFPELKSFAKLKRHPHIEGWLLELASAQPHFASSTRSKRIYTVSRFFEDIWEWNWPESPQPGLIHSTDFPPEPHYLPRPLPPDVDAHLMEALREKGNIFSLGLVLARRTGLRIGELCRLELDCIQESPAGSYSLRVPLGKLRSERVIPVDQETADLIENIRYLRGDKDPIEDPETGRSVQALFCCGRHSSFTHRATFGDVLKAVAQSSGITENVHPHRLRHTFATELLRNGLTLPAVMKLLGHTTLRMTLRYVEVTNEDLGRDYLKAMERVRQRYPMPMPEEVLDLSLPGEQGPRQAVDAAFNQIVARVQALRFDHPDPARRRKLQRFVERLRRAQGEIPDLLP
jgi:site-specific recombinase XerD